MIDPAGDTTTDVLAFKQRCDTTPVFYFALLICATFLSLLFFSLTACSSVPVDDEFVDLILRYDMK